MQFVQIGSVGVKNKFLFLEEGFPENNELCEY